MDSLRLRPYYIALLLFFAALLLYLLTLAPSVVTLFDDSLEFQLVTWQLGIAHPTGYPLYTLLGKLFTFLPVGNVAYRVNLMSAVFGAGAVALLFLLTLEVFPPTERGAGWPRVAGAVIGAMFLAVGPVFWQQATIAEVYSLNAFWVTLILWAAFKWTTLESVPGLAFLVGLSLAHHRTTLLLLPALGVLLLMRHGRALFGPKLIGQSLLWGAAPLLLYLYLPWRGYIGSLDGTYENSWAGFWRHISGGGYSLFLFDNPFAQQRDAAFYGRLLADQFYTIVPGLLGLAALIWRGPRRAVAVTGLAFVTYFGFNLFYNVADIEVFFIPVFLLWAVWSGIGAAFLWQATTVLARPGWRPVAGGLFLGIFLFMAIQLGQQGWSQLRQAYSWRIHDYGLDMLQQPLPPNSAVVGIVGEMTLLRYFQQTENMRPDLATVAADREPDRLAAVENLLQQGRPVFLTRPLSQAENRWSLHAVGPLIRVNSTPVTTLPHAVTPVNQPVTPHIELAGYAISRPPHTGSGLPPVRLTLYWRCRAAMTDSLKISARLLDEAGQPVAVLDGEPVHFAYPTPAWRPGEIVSDVYDLSFGAGQSPGLLSPLLIWYNPAQNAAEVGRIELPPLPVN